MAKRGMDEEVLAIQRAAREIEKIDDEAGQARVAFYLYLRYTAAGDKLLPNAVPEPPRWVPAGGGIAGPAIATPSAPQRAPEPAPAPTGAPTSAPAPAGDTGDAGGKPGWDLSGKGSEQDDDDVTDAVDKEEGTESPDDEPVTFEGKGGDADDDETEVEI